MDLLVQAIHRSNSKPPVRSLKNFSPLKYKKLRGKTPSITETMGFFSKQVILKQITIRVG
jgi:hypothetical protein